MRPVNRGDRPTDSNGNLVEFKEYGDARPYLINRLGQYCSYCEIWLPMGLAVEHIQPKGNETALEKEWSNFLLSCPSCNSRKSKKVVNAENLHDYYWPHCDNTFRVFIYENDRAPQIAKSLNEAQQRIARNTLELTGLDLEPISRKNVKDPRWTPRYTAWRKAEWAKEDFNRDSGEAMRLRIVDTAITTGFWSIWMTVFQDYADMRRRLIEAFQGTSEECFDHNAQPIQRAGGKI